MNWWACFWGLMTIIFLIMGTVSAIFDAELRMIVVSFAMAVFSLTEQNYNLNREFIESKVAAWNVNGDGK